MSSLLTTLLIIVALLFLWMIAWGVFWFLVQAGVIVQKALEPPAQDSGDYSLDKVHEVKREQP